MASRSSEPQALDAGGAAPSGFFVSYAREDQAFVRRLYEALVGRGREVWVDWEAVPALADWRAEVTAAIEAADVFVFVISPDSAQSEVCLLEISIAAAAHKRFAPLVLHEVEAEELPAPVSAPNWLFFRDWDDFDDGVGRLVVAADTDFAWLRLHTRLQVRARDWDDAERDDSLLARGRDLEAAQHWLAESALRTERDVSPLQVAFLEAAREREAAEAERTRELYARALARQLAAQSELVRGADVESVRTSVLLAAESVERWPTVEGDRALRRGLALLSRRPLRRIEHRARHVALGRDGLALATAEGRSVSIWDVPSGRLLARRRCDAEVTSLTVSADGAWILAVDAEDRARLWRADGRGRGRGFDCGAPVVVATVALEGECVAIATAEAIIVWTPGRRPSALRVPVDGDVTALAIAAGGAGLVATVNVGWNGSLRTWSLPAGEPIDPIALGGIVNAAAFSTEGDVVVALAVPTGPGMGPLRGYEDVKLLHLLESWRQERLIRHELRHDTPVRRLALGPGDEHVATVAEPATVHVWSAQTGRPHGRITSATPVRTFAVSPDGDRLATAHDDGTVRLTDVATASTVLAVEADARAVALGADGHLVVTGDDATVVWSAETGAEIARAQVGFPITLAFGPDRLMVSGGDSSLVLLSTNDGGVTSLPHEGPVLGAAFVPGGRRVVTVSGAGIGSEGHRGDDDLRVWDVAERTVVSRIARAELGVFALSPDGRRLADATAAEVEVRDVATGDITHRLTAGAEVTELKFAPDGERLAVVAGDALVRVWDLADAEPEAGPERRLDNAWIAAVDPAGRYLAVQGSGYFSAWLLDLELDRKIVADVEQSTYHAELDPAGRFAALTTDLGPVEVRALPSAEVVVRVPHDAFGVAFSPDGTHFATAGADGSLRVWEMAGGDEVARMDHAGKLFSPTFDGDGRLLAASCADGSVWVWTWRPADLAAEARARAGRGLTAEERAAYLPDG
jgi:WD40 repeat protein